MSRIAMLAYTNYVSDPRVRREAEALASRGDDVVFYCLRAPGEEPKEIRDGVTVRRLPLKRYRGGNPIAYVFGYCAFLLIALFVMTRDDIETRVDLVHVNNMPDFMVFAATPLRLLGRPLILDIHDLMPELYEAKFHASPRNPLIVTLRLQELASARFASRVLTSEHTKREALIEHGIAPDRVTVLLNLPDPRVFGPVRNPIVRQDKDKGFRLVYHGTLAYRLGLDIALRAVSLLKAEIQDLEFDILGDGDQRGNLLELRDHLGLQNQVSFSEGMVPVESLPQRLSGADLAVVPTRCDIGTRFMLPTKLVEYAHLCIPAVVAPTHTIRHYFSADQVEFFEPEDPESLAERILFLYENPERRLSLATNARAFAQNNQWDDHREIYYEVVDELLKGKRVVTDGRWDNP